MPEIECKISKIIINEQRDGQIIWIQESEGSRAFAVIVGFFEAGSLRDRIRDFTPPRPMTHNLIVNCINGLGGKLQKVVLTALKENTYYANLIVEQDGRTVAIDTRPSDGLVLAMQEKVPIYVSEDVLNEASKWSFEPQIDIALKDLEDAFGEEFEDLEGFDSGDEYDEDDDDDDVEDYSDGF